MVKTGGLDRADDTSKQAQQGLVHHGDRNAVANRIERQTDLTCVRNKEPETPAGQEQKSPTTIRLGDGQLRA